MNEAEKEILQSSLSEEEKVLKFLKRTYERAKKECIEKIAQLSEKESLNPANLQSIIYQKKYQEVLLMQINSTLSNLQTDNYKTIDDYLNKCYEEGFTGALYSINKQGIPIIAPIDNKQVIQAIYNDTKLSQGLYERLGENVEELKISIKSNVSRGIVEGKSWTEVASGIANDMNTPFKKAMNNAMRIARTEGGRVQQQAQMDACRKAVARGADIVKQWDSTLDGRTRDSHRAMSGEVRELEEKFSNGLLHPKDKDGPASEVVNCRCVMLQRARWALGEGFTNIDNSTGDLKVFDSAKDFDEFKREFFSVENMENLKIDAKIKENAYKSKTGKKYLSKTSRELDALGITYNQVETYEGSRTTEEIIERLTGADRTGGSCSSVGLAYIGQKRGYDVLDFRGGKSKEYFTSKPKKVEMFNELNAVTITVDKFKTNLPNAKEILKYCELGKEYYLSVGTHASVIRLFEDANNSKVYQYLELQSSKSFGWKNFTKDPEGTLLTRFGCCLSPDRVKEAYLTDIDTIKDDEKFKEILGFINTSKSKQVKGVD